MAGSGGEGRYGGRRTLPPRPRLLTRRLHIDLLRVCSAFGLSG